MSEPNTPPPPPPRRRRLRRVALVLVVLLVLAFAAPIAAWAWLCSPAGGRFVRDRIVSAANETLAGRLEIAEVRLAGLLRVELEGIRLFAPDEEEPTFSLTRAVADVRATSILARRIDLREFALDRPDVRIEEGPEGDSLSRAISPRMPKDEERQPSSGSGDLPDIFIHAPEISLRGGTVELIGEPHARVHPIDLTVALEGTPAELAVAVQLSLGLERPVERSLTLETQLTYLGDSVRVERLQLDSGASSLDLTAQAALDGTHATAELKQLLLAASDVHAFVPDAGLLGDVTLTGTARVEDGTATSALRLALPSGAVVTTLRATLPSGDQPLRYALDLNVSELQPHRIVAGLPPAQLQVEASYEGEGLPPENRGTLRLDASGSRYENLLLDRVTLAAAIEGLGANIESLDVRTAATRLTASGRASAEDVALKANVTVADLARTRLALQRGLGLELPELAGRVVLDADVRGAPEAPRISAKLHVPELAADGIRVEDLHFGVLTSRLLPLPRGSITLQAKLIEAGELRAEKLKLDGSIDGQIVRADLTGLLADTPVGMTVRGQRQQSRRAGHERWRFDRLSARVLGLSVASETTAFIEAGDGRVRVEKLVVGGDLGRVSVDADVGATGRLDGKIALRGLRLENLPGALLPSDLHPGGLIEADVALAGHAEDPELDVTLRWKDGRLLRLAPLGLELETTLRGGRLQGVIAAAMPNAGLVVGEWELPVKATRQQQRPMKAMLRIERLDLGLAHAIAPDAPELAGHLSGALDLGGTLSRPEATMQLLVSDLALAPLDAVSVVLDASYDDGNAVALARVDRPRTLGLELRARMPVDMDRALEGKIDPQTLPLDIEVDLERLDLQWLAARELAPPEVRGIAAGAFAFRGSLKTPEAEALLAVRDLEAGGQRLSALTTTLHAKDEVVLRAHTELDGRPWAELEATLKTALATLLDGRIDELYASPFSLAATIPPTALERLAPPAPGETPFSGVLSAALSATGTPNTPELTFEAHAEDLKADGAPLGRFDAELDYRDARTLLDARYTSALDGRLRIAGTLHANLGAQSVLADALSHIGERHADLLIEAKAFDIAAFNGLDPTLRELGGRLDLLLAKTGPLLAPSGEGHVRLTGGRATLVELGTFSELELAANLNLPGFKLERLTGRYGPGRFSARAEATPMDDGMRGNVNVELEDVPLVQNFQTRAFLGLNLAAAGTLRGDYLEVPELRITRGLLKIPERLQKSVQSMDPHPDVVFTDDEQADAAQDSGLAYRARIGVVIPDDFRVEAPLGTNVTFGANLDVTLDPALATDDRPPVDVTGSARIARGSINLLDRRFQVDEGRIQFFSRNFDDPSLNIKAHYRGDDATVLVDISGTAQAPQTNFTSTPPMDPAEIFFYLATGQRQTRAQTETVGVGERALDTGLSLAGSAVAGVAKMAIQKVLPKQLEPDVLAVETDVSRMSVRTRAGKYVTNRLYIGGQYNPGADPMRWENLVELELQYRLNDSNFIQLRGGEGRSQFEFLFQRNIPAPSQRRSKVAR